MLWLIVISVIMFALSTEAAVVEMWGDKSFDIFEWVVTIIFSIEYGLRLYAGMISHTETLSSAATH
jgi:hypothetical protein